MVSPTSEQDDAPLSTQHSVHFEHGVQFFQAFLDNVGWICNDTLYSESMPLSGDQYVSFQLLPERWNFAEIDVNPSKDLSV